MVDNEFEWDDAKAAAANVAKHGVSFERAKLEREGRVRIISARRANRYERQTYVEKRGP